jgi:hypothetical protein
MSEQAKREYDKTLKRMFEEAQAKLPEERRAANSVEDMCMHKHDGYSCTLSKQHFGNHIAHGTLGTIIAEWENLTPHFDPQSI